MPVGISIGKPKFPLGYECIYLREAAPWGLREIADHDEFSERYVARLNRLGIDLFLQRFRGDLCRARWTRALSLVLRACRSVVPSPGARVVARGADGPACARASRRSTGVLLITLVSS